MSAVSVVSQHEDQRDVKASKTGHYEVVKQAIRGIAKTLGVKINIAQKQECIGDLKNSKQSG